MVSNSNKAHKRTAMYRNLQLLRSITHSSHSRRKSSVLFDASAYIKDLKQRLQELIQLATAQKLLDYDPIPMLKVEPQEEGFKIKVLSQRSCQGLLVFILEAFEELGLDVVQARVSCAQNFTLEATAIKDENSRSSHLELDAQIVEQVVSQAIQNWREVTSRQ